MQINSVRFELAEMPSLEIKGVAEASKSSAQTG
jgi:hypothetical protein